MNNQGGKFAVELSVSMKIEMIFQTVGRVWLVIILVSFLKGCDVIDPVVETPPDPPISEQTADGFGTHLPPTIEPSLTPRVPILPATPENTALATIPGQPILLSSTPTPEIICDLAGAGNPLDVTIPDDTRMLPGESFSKTWRLENRGNCVWTHDYSLAWFSGSNFGAAHLQPLYTQVSTGESVDITIDMTSPEDPGVYTGYWMLRNPKGDLFGIGPAGNSPFWVRIQVLAVSTITPTVTLTHTPTPIVQASGTVELSIDGTLDLDFGVINPKDGEDLVLRTDVNGFFVLIPLNNSRIALYADGRPEISDCRRALLEGQPFELEGLELPTFLCYQTNLGSPGMAEFLTLPNQDQPLIFNFLTWVVP